MHIKNMFLWNFTLNINRLIRSIFNMLCSIQIKS